MTKLRDTIYCHPLDCGRGSMVELELPKLTTRVRFPSPAPKKIKAGLQFRTEPHRWRFIRRPTFLMGASRFCQLTWDIGKAHPALSASLFHRIYLIALGGVLLLSLRVMRFFRRIYPGVAIQPSRKQKSRLFCNFFAVADVVVPGSYMALPFRYEKAFQGEGSS